MSSSTETLIRKMPPMDEGTFLAMMDRFVDPIRAQMNSLDKKLDRVLEIGERVSVQESTSEAIDDRLRKVEADTSDSKTQLNQMKGRNQILHIIVGIMGTSMAALAAAAVKHLTGL